MATGLEIATLDAVQYLDGGPCVTAAGQDREVAVDRQKVLDEGRWQMFAKAEAASGIEASLSLPITRAGQVTGGVNLYATQAGAFEGRHEALAELFGAWAEGAVTNADLSFNTRRYAAEAPAIMQTQATIDQAIGVIVASQRVSQHEARRRLEQAAGLAGVSAERLAGTVLEAVRT